MAITQFNEGNLVDKYKIGSTQIEVYDGALVSFSKKDPKVKTIISRIGIIAAQAARKNAHRTSTAQN